MKSPEFAAMQKEMDARIGLRRCRGKGPLMQNKEAGFYILPFFQSKILLTYVFRGNTSGPFLFPRRHFRFLRTEKAFGDHPGPPSRTCLRLIHFGLVELGLRSPSHIQVHAPVIWLIGSRREILKTVKE